MPLDPGSKAGMTIRKSEMTLCEGWDDDMPLLDATMPITVAPWFDAH